MNTTCTRACCRVWLTVVLAANQALLASAEETPAEWRAGMHHSWQVHCSQFVNPNAHAAQLTQTATCPVRKTPENHTLWHVLCYASSCGWFASKHCRMSAGNTQRRLNCDALSYTAVQPGSCQPAAPQAVTALSCSCSQQAGPTSSCECPS